MGSRSLDSRVGCKRGVPILSTIKCGSAINAGRARRTNYGTLAITLKVFVPKTAMAESHTKAVLQELCSWKGVGSSRFDDVNGFPAGCQSKQPCPLCASCRIVPESNCSRARSSLPLHLRYWLPRLYWFNPRGKYIQNTPARIE
jgi:hypothetical protein